MTSQNSSSLISSIYKSRLNILELMSTQGYNISEYDNFGINEINAMKSNDQLDMILEKTEPNEQTKRHDKIYINYYLSKTIRPQNIQEMIDDLFVVEQFLTTDDILYIITKDDLNESLTNNLKHIWERDKIFIIVQNISRLQFNILKHVLVPKHTIISETEKNNVKRRYNIMNDGDFPDLSRFDPVSQVICIRPGQVCKIIRPSKTAITAPYYRICV